MSILTRLHKIVRIALVLLLVASVAGAYPITNNVQRMTQYMSTTPIINSQGTSCSGGSCAVCASITTVTTIIPAAANRGMYCIYTSALLNAAYGDTAGTAPAITPTSTHGIPLGPINVWLCEVGAPGNRLDAIPQTGTASVCTIEYPLH